MKKGEKFQREKLGKPGYINKNCWVVKTLNYSPSKRCQYCELKFHNCLFFQYLIISLILILFFLTLSFFIEGEISKLLIISIFTLVIVYGYFFNKSTEKIIKANFAQRKAKEALKELAGTLQQKVDAQTKDLKDLLKMKSEFLTIASHQLRTPTSIVRGYLSMAEDERIAEPEKKNFIGMAYEGINRMERIIHDILSATELEGGKLKLNPHPEKLTDILEDVVKGLQGEADKKNLQLKYEVGEKAAEWPEMELDKLKVQEAITNLVANAIYYTEKGEVVLRVKETLTKGKKYARIEVRDTGIGFSEEDKVKLAEKFFRAPGAKNVHPDGSGLGLFITKKIIESSGGFFEFNSPGIGKGSVFAVYLPLE